MATCMRPSKASCDETPSEPPSTCIATKLPAQHPLIDEYPAHHKYPAVAKQQETSESIFAVGCCVSEHGVCGKKGGKTATKRGACVPDAVV